MDRRSSNNPSHEVKVLCLGMSRTGTMSLRAAFATIGYNVTYHYRVPSIEKPSHSDFWLDAFKKKLECHERLMRDDFDKVFADFDVVTDSPSVFFWHELLEAYPDAESYLADKTDGDLVQEPQDQHLGIQLRLLWTNKEPVSVALSALAPAWCFLGLF